MIGLVVEVCGRGGGVGEEEDGRGEKLSGKGTVFKKKMCVRSTVLKHMDGRRYGVFN